ncbi:antA/AntB antirepressor family protein [Bartonella sp. CM31XJBT]|uniref:antA/AntB antirepressor family protein n=1 Tax=Bartonella sp. CM31XJBT TaxID=3019090 RepID=UPI0023616741|nr:antA/AntB antirepressor family protein [Bartonella sp. CM31XJBT]
MNTLIKISEQAVGQEIIQTVNARELHVFLEVKRDFSNWIKDRINKYSFLKNQDYIVFTNFGENLQGGRPSTEYHLTLDMAKELSMVERNEKGRQARRYFIECEKKLRNQAVDYELFSYECFKKPAGIGEILGLMMRRLLDANDLEKELDHYKSVTKEAKRVLARSVVKAA